MPRVLEIVYYTDNGSRISYLPVEPEQISDQSMSVIIRLIDGEEIVPIAENL